MSEQKTVRWGILGAARVNERLLPAIVEANNAELVAIASRRAGAAKEVLMKYAPEQTQVETFDELEALLSHPEIDAIYLPMANEEHEKILKQGVKVWNEWREKNPPLRLMT